MGNKSSTIYVLIKYQTLNFVCITETCLDAPAAPFLAPFLGIQFIMNQVGGEGVSVEKKCGHVDLIQPKMYEVSLSNIGSDKSVSIKRE